MSGLYRDKHMCDHWILVLGRHLFHYYGSTGQKFHWIKVRKDETPWDPNEWYTEFDVYYERR